ncbi:28S ribosomal protein S18c, mitochondrial [Athalia rosae]|uniref:28S ribosomal protein S18c, mitochondrial n=1 Tax=Athalia rosae TaxID=37344 RepID=UPI000A0EDF5C|nr:28S ribosomal protein S18c, mitochondrial [Athalia rosae]
MTSTFENTSRKVLNNKGRLLWRSSYRSVNTTTEVPNNEDTDDLPIKMDNPFARETIKCILCTHNIEPDYKNPRLLSQFQSRYTGRIYGRHITGLCTRKQQRVEEEIVKAQNAEIKDKFYNLGLMPYYLKEVAYVKDPLLFDPDHPFRPHKY